MDDEQKRKILEVLRQNEFGVIATNGTQAPESAVVAVSETEDLEIIFGSFDHNRKNKNIKNNPNISIVIGWDKIIKKTLQIEGIAILTEGEEREMAENIHCAKNKGSNVYRGNSKQEYFKVKPVWIRYSDFSVNPKEVWEVNV